MELKEYCADRNVRDHEERARHTVGVEKERHLQARDKWELYGTMVRAGFWPDRLWDEAIEASTRAGTLAHVCG